MKYTAPLNATHDNDHYVDANPALGIEGSIVSAAAIEPAMREVVNTITAAGLTPSADDMTQLTQAVKRLSANAAGENSIPTYYAGEFKDFFEQTPPVGWAVRDGHVLSNADVNFPALWLELQKPENAWKLKTEAEWQAMAAKAAAASPYKVGGVPYFVLDTDAKTIKLPDTRTDFLRNANGNVGDWQGDAIRNMTGSISSTTAHVFAPNRTSGVFMSGAVTGALPDTAPDILGASVVSFNASNQVPTAPENRPRNIALLGCVCIEPAKAQRNEATTTTPGAVYLASGGDDQRANAVPSVVMAAGLGMPSGRNIDLPVSVSPISYTTQADGYISMQGTSSAAGQYIRLINDTASHIVSESESVLSTDDLYTFIPCNKGDLIRIAYNISAANIKEFRFIYAQGAY